MNIVIDANIFIVTLIQDSKVRELLFRLPHTFLFPAVHFEELKEHEQELLKKSGLSFDELYLVKLKLLSYVSIVPETTSRLFKQQAKQIIDTIDPDDVPIIATSLAFNSCPIWTDDKDFQRQHVIPILTTSQIIAANQDISQ